ncbi:MULTISPECIES: 16S rRNA (guanine(527)-N(7))-methyltransferase RsmG [unclassified Campylobacter]|uniref:16S rRNA (guanine(527)-N(7))-methyltransferase RsmG n=1 Tax=unclassified Campylobacter TaxID=2593542 RepID=UPI001CC1E9C1|nr:MULTISPECIES: 16S rRNA (guanine(527)-N(7))-methyltransferase RsmG [unclassified Campylobacter]
MESEFSEFSFLDDNFFQKIKLYKDLLNEFNAVHNLTNFKDINKEVKDSIRVLKFKDLNWAKNIIDIGSGAGFPAVFLALILKANFYLFEPNAKKVSFLYNIKIKCDIKNIHIIKEKIQDYKAPFIADIITSRALMSVDNLIKISKNFFNEKSLFVLYKGSNLEKELSNFKEYEIIENGLRKYCFLQI